MLLFYSACCLCFTFVFFFFFFKQKTAYEMRISDWSSDVCSSDLSHAYNLPPLRALRDFEAVARHKSLSAAARSLSITPAAVSRQITLLEGRLQCRQIGRASCRERVCQYV